MNVQTCNMTQLINYITVGSVIYLYHNFTSGLLDLCRQYSSLILSASPEHAFKNLTQVVHITEFNCKKFQTAKFPDKICFRIFGQYNDNCFAILKYTSNNDHI